MFLDTTHKAVPLPSSYVSAFLSGMLAVTETKRPFLSTFTFLSEIETQGSLPKNRQKQPQSPFICMTNMMTIMMTMMTIMMRMKKKMMIMSMGSSMDGLVGTGGYSVLAGE